MVHKTLPSGKRRDETAEEFGETLIAYRDNRKADRQVLGYARFQ